MNHIDFFKENNAKSFSELYLLNGLIEKKIISNDLNLTHKVNLSIAASSSTNGLGEVLRVQCAKYDIDANVCISEYNQHVQEILNPKSSIYSCNPEIIFLSIDLRTLSGLKYFNPYESILSANQFKDWAKEIIDLFNNLLESALNNSNATIILSNLETPIFSPLGLAESKQDFGFFEAVKNINQDLGIYAKNNNRVFLFDYDLFLSKLGKDNTFDSKMYYLGDLKLKTKYIPNLCYEYSRFVKALKIAQKKCLVLDLDNTLWGGILGEEGIEGINLGPSPEGKSFLEFQHHILGFHQRGIILAINSKNNFDEAMEAINNHPHMVLKEKHFSSIKINWNDKVQNLKEISQDINIGLDSLVFFDDDDFNKELVKSMLPMVEVADLPKDFTKYSDFLINSSYFDTLNLTIEDLKKGEMYSQENERKKSKINFENIEDYLMSLEMKILIEENNIDHSERVLQLTQKTNQFNMTSIRYSADQIEFFFNSVDHEVYTLSLSDKFGDYGLTGVLIVKKGANWKIETFLMSCRILGRRIENAFLSYVSEKAVLSKAKKLEGIFLETAKNFPAKDTYQNLGFKNNFEDKKIWIFDLKNQILFPKFINYNQKL